MGFRLKTTHEVEDALRQSAMYIVPMPDEYSMKYALGQVENAICEYCNIDRVPVGLYFTWVDMAQDWLSYLASQQTYNSSDIEGADSVDYGANQKIKMIKEGDTTIQFIDPRAHDYKGSIHGVGFDFGVKTTPIEALTKNYVAQLNKYRRFKWK